MRPLWSGTLSFGLVSIPIELYPATRRKRAPLRLLAPDGTPLSRRFYSPLDGAEVTSDQLARGYEIETGEYIVVTDAELSALEPQKSRDIDLRLFVAAKAIDPIYFDRAFYLMPSGTSSKAYGLLVSVMERSQRAGIATFVMHDSEHLVAIFAVDGVLHAQTLRFYDEVRAVDDVGLPAPSASSPALRRGFEKALGAVARKKFSPHDVTNDSTDKVIELARSKHRKGADVIEVELPELQQQPLADVIDLMEVLKRSIETGDASKRRASRRGRKA